MKQISDIFFNCRILVGELGSTLALVFLVGFGTYKAWQDFVIKPYEERLRDSRVSVRRRKGNS